MLAVLMSAVMIFVLCAPCIGAADDHTQGNQENEEGERLIYVSIGDAATNGYGGEGGAVNYEKNTYANRFAAWLAGYVGEIADGQVIFEGPLAAVDHRQLAMNGLRAEDLRRILELDDENESLMQSLYEAWESCEGEFRTGDRRTGALLCGEDSVYADAAARILSTYAKTENKGYFQSSYASDVRVQNAADGLLSDPYYPKNKSETDAIGGYAYLQIATEFYRRSIQDADIISLSLGDANVRWMLDELSEILKGNTEGFSGNYDIERIFDLADLAPDAEEQVRGLIAELDKILGESLAGLSDGSPETLCALKEAITYCLIGYAVNYIGALEDILALNPDAAIIQIALVNPYADAENLPVGIALDLAYDAVNAFTAAFPTCMQALGEKTYEKATFLYAAPDAIPCSSEGYPTEVGHKAIFEAVRDAYANGHTSFDQTLCYLRDFVCEYYDEIYAFAYAQAQNSGLIARLCTRLDEAVGAIRAAEEWAFGYEEYFRSEAFALRLRASAESAVASVEALRDLISRAERLDSGTYAKAVALLENLQKNLLDLAALLQTVALDASAYAYAALKPEIVRALTVLNEKLNTVLETAASVKDAVKELLSVSEAQMREWIAIAEKYLSAWLGGEILSPSYVRALLRERFAGAFSSNYHLSQDSHYLAIGDDTLYAELLAARAGLRADQFDTMGWDALDSSRIAQADLITVGYSERMLSGFAMEQIRGYVKNYIENELRGSVNAYADEALRHFFSNMRPVPDESFADAIRLRIRETVNGAFDAFVGQESFASAEVQEPDWAALLGEENAFCAEHLRASIRAALVKAGIPEIYTYEINTVDRLLEQSERIDPSFSALISLFDTDMIVSMFGEYAVFRQEIPLLDALAFALESYLYGYIQFNVEYARLVYAIGAVNSDAQVVLLGSYHAFDDLGLDITWDGITLSTDMLPALPLKDSFDGVIRSALRILAPIADAHAFDAVFRALDERMARIYAEIQSVHGYVTDLDFTEAIGNISISDLDLVSLVGEENAALAEKLVHVVKFLFRQTGLYDRVMEEIPTAKALLSSFAGDVINEKSVALMEEAFAQAKLTLSEAKKIARALSDYAGSIRGGLINIQNCIDTVYASVQASEWKIDGVSFDLGEALGAPTLAHSLFYALRDENVIFVDISEASTICVADSIEEFLYAYFLDSSAADVSEEGHAYIAERISDALMLLCNHEDLNRDHICDICEWVLSVCVDADSDHLCDICGKTLSVCEDRDRDHLCDICGKRLGECLDWNDDHLCDICGKVLGECADTDRDHLCDVCGNALSVCADADNDHVCDVCGKTLSACADTDRDHLCDVCGKALSVCADTNADHTCDLCGKTLSICADTDSDHLCDLCGKTLSICADTDSDHLCDLCGKTLSVCEDTDSDHRCDICGDVLSVCVDENNDHTCDVCGVVCSVCADPNRDHACDICGTVLSVCAYGDWTVTEAPTRKEEGERFRACSICGATEFEVIPALGLPTLAVWAISAGAVACMSIAAYTVFWCVRKHRRKQTEKETDEE